MSSSYLLTFRTFLLRCDILLLRNLIAENNQRKESGVKIGCSKGTT